MYKMKFEEFTRPYTEGEKLTENEHLIKYKSIREEIPVAFLAKPKKADNLPPLNLINWPRWQKGSEIRVINEDFREGWKIAGFRSGESQSWASVLHPYGFILEIYLSDFMNHIMGGDRDRVTGSRIRGLVDPEGTVDIKDGVLQGSFKWAGNKLIKK